MYISGPPSYSFVTIIANASQHARFVPVMSRMRSLVSTASSLSLICTDAPVVSPKFRIVEPLRPMMKPAELLGIVTRARMSTSSFARLAGAVPETRGRHTRSTPVFSFVTWTTAEVMPRVVR